MYNQSITLGRIWQAEDGLKWSKKGWKKCIALFALFALWSAKVQIAFGNRFAMVNTAMLNWQATYASALPKNQQILGDPGESAKQKKCFVSIDSIVSLRGEKRLFRCKKWWNWQNWQNWHAKICMRNVRKWEKWKLLKFSQFSELSVQKIAWDSWDSWDSWKALNINEWKASVSRVSRISVQKLITKQKQPIIINRRFGAKILT